jgi:aminoglycoside phosphotransferase (APT) family kinase protein
MSADLLAALGVAPADFIDQGRESAVYALGGERIARVFRTPQDPAALARLQAFLAGIDGRLRVATPRIETIDAGGRYTIERRLAGTSLLRRLPRLEGAERSAALRNFVAAADVPAALTLADKPYGHLLEARPLAADTWTAFLAACLERALARNRATIARAAGDAAAVRRRALALLDTLPARPRKALVHGDWFAGNVLLGDDLAVSGIVDFGVYTMVGDPLYDAATAALFLEMTDAATAADAAAAGAFARQRHGDAIVATARFCRLYAAVTMADPAYAAPPHTGLHAWSLATLKAVATGELAD